MYFLYRWRNRRSVRGNLKTPNKKKRRGRRVRKGQPTETWVHMPGRRERIRLLKKGFRSVFIDYGLERPWYWWF